MLKNENDVELAPLAVDMENQCQICVLLDKFALLSGAERDKQQICCIHLAEKEACRWTRQHAPHGCG